MVQLLTFILAWKMPMRTLFFLISLNVRNHLKIRNKSRCTLSLQQPSMHYHPAASLIHPPTTHVPQTESGRAVRLPPHLAELQNPTTQHTLEELIEKYRRVLINMKEKDLPIGSYFSIRSTLLHWVYQHIISLLPIQRIWEPRPPSLTSIKSQLWKNLDALWGLFSRIQFSSMWMPSITFTSIPNAYSATLTVNSRKLNKQQLMR